ncbi:hypothetical protein C5167_047097 [Papaver somniferum]|uniref:Uncharacterized protein n=1 Tax=Papaver somniferum TaxID=3469 RepID=A0A4Y7LI39_PAPSO|nr:hypothetical protein C5167_047097 [Papaver somniferum]
MSSMVDKGWMNCSRNSAQYGIQSTYTTWRFHGENLEVEAQSLEDNTNNANLAENVENVGDVVVDPAIGVRDDLGDVVEDVDAAIGVDDNFGIDSGIHNDVGSRKRKKKNSVYERAKEPLYPSCPKGVTALYASIKLNHIKTQYGFYDNGMTSILELMKELLPKENMLPSKYPEVKNMIQELGMDYITYDAYVNDCIFHWKDCALLVQCHVCQESRYKKVFNDERKITTIAQKTIQEAQGKQPSLESLKRKRKADREAEIEGDCSAVSVRLLTTKDDDRFRNQKKLMSCAIWVPVLHLPCEFPIPFVVLLHDADYSQQQ